MQGNQRWYVPCCECGALIEVAKATALRYGRGESCIVCEVCLVISQGTHSHGDKQSK